MKKINLSIFVLLFLCFWQTSAAVTMIELKQANSSIDKIYIDGLKVRIDSSIEPGYVIIDAGKRKMYIVSHQEKQIMDMGNVMNKDKSDTKKYNVKFINKGKGPKIAGYTTQHYIVRVNGKKCSDEYTSKKIAKDFGIEKALEKIFTLPEETEMEMTQGMNECLLAESQISSMYSQYGYALRSLDANGMLDFEVIRLNKNASLPPGGFSLPKGYKNVNMGAMMQDLEQKIPQMTPEGMQNMTQEQIQQMQQMMEKMMKKMGETGK